MSYATRFHLGPFSLATVCGVTKRLRNRYLEYQDLGIFMTEVHNLLIISHNCFLVLVLFSGGSPNDILTIGLPIF
jgi:hypothetical protein